MKNRILNIILSILIFGSAFSQNYNIKHYTVKDGLLHAFVNDIIQDSRGNIWIATGGGLCKFNGVEFNSYTTKDGLNYPRLLCLAEDDFNNIWIGTSVGLNVFDGDSIYSLKNKLKENILAFEKSLDGQMWVSSNEGVKKVQLKNGEFVIDKLQYDFGKIEETNIFQDRNKNSFLIESNKHQLFIGLNNLIYIYEKNKIEKIEIDKSLQVYSACRLANTEIVFGTNNGLYIYRDNDLVRIENEKLNGFKVYKIKRKEDKLWMIGKWDNEEKDELFLLSINLNNESYYRKITVINGLIDNPTSLFIDHENNIWTGSNGGLSVLKGESFVNYTTKNGIVGNKIWGLFQDIDNRIWLGTINEGLSIIDGDKITNFDLEDGLPDMYIGAIYQDKKDFIYLGTARKGLCIAQYNSKLNTYKFRQLNVELNNGKTRIDGILRDKNNTLWIASSKGLYYSLDDIKFHHKVLFDGDSNQVFIQRILLSGNGDLYVGTKRRGLFVLKGNKVENILNDTINGLGISSICEDSEGGIWLGSQHKGIFKLNEGKNKWITEKDGLKSNLIYILQSDKNGNIWIGSNLGLDRFNVLKYNKTGEIEIHHYDTDDGLQALEMNLNGSIEDNQGNLWFATNNGILKYDYRYDISNRIPPIINILNIKLYSKLVDWKKYSDSLSVWDYLPINPVLPYNQNHLTFEFVGISYKNPKEIKYSWKLEGFDKTWVPSTYNRQVIYSNLPYGKYVFKLKSSNNDGVWNKKILEFPFEIQPPVWATWWFITLIIVFIILLIYLLIVWRTNSLKKRQKELKKLVYVRTKEITLQKEELKSQRDTVYEQKNQIEKIHLRLSDSIEYAERIQSSILPENNILEKYLSDHFVLFKPKDKVSGDFYWWTHIENHTIITAVDCTGHGVPGAFMSMLGVSFLREIVMKEYITHPGVILRKLRKEIIKSLKQKEDIASSLSMKDGMDMALISINNETNVLQYAGANNPLYLIKSEKLKVESEAIKLYELSTSNFLLYEVKPDKMPISIYEKMDKFVTHEIQLEKGDQLYLFSDGYPDQFGGAEQRKFRYKPFRQMLLDNANKNMKEQKEILNKAFEDWKGDIEQVDDVVVIGIKI